MKFNNIMLGIDDNRKAKTPLVLDQEPDIFDENFQNVDAKVIEDDQDYKEEEQEEVE